MKKVIDVKWRKNMLFEADVDGNKLNLDVSSSAGGSGLGPTPKPLMLVALGGCTGMDVVSVLNKMKIKFSYFNVKVEGELTEEHPKYFHTMKIIYELKGEVIDINKVKKAVELSMNKYCGVSAVYKKAINLTYEIKILD